MSETKTIKIKVLRAFRMSGLDPSTPKYENGVIGVDGVIVVPKNFGLGMIAAKKAVQVEDSEPVKKGVPPAAGGPKSDVKKGA